MIKKYLFLFITSLVINFSNVSAQQKLDPLELIKKIKLDETEVLISDVNEQRFAFVLAYNLKDNGDLTFYRAYKLFKQDGTKPIFCTELGFIGSNKMAVFDMDSRSLILFEDESI